MCVPFSFFYPQVLVFIPQLDRTLCPDDLLPLAFLCWPVSCCSCHLMVVGYSICSSSSVDCSSTVVSYIGCCVCHHVMGMMCLVLVGGGVVLHRRLLHGVILAMVC